MAKGNMLQGMARGKVGDVVFSRLNGQQISRVRNRNPHNPRTNPQLYQRAIMATVMLAYSNTKEICDHSFQGKAKGAENQRQFMKLNAKLLRNIIADDLNNNSTLSNQEGRVVAPGSLTAVPFAMQISEGSYPQNLFTVSSNDGGPTIALPEAEENEKVSEYAERNGLIAGDIYTILAAGEGSDVTFVVSNKTDSYAKQKSWNWGWIRLTVKDGLDNVDTAVSKWGDLFDIENSGDFEGSGLTADRQLSYAINVMLFTSNDYAAAGVIRSRKDSDLRSTSFLTSLQGAQTGIPTEYIIDAWKSGATPVGDSDLILEGGDI